MISEKYSRSKKNKRVFLLIASLVLVFFISFFKNADAATLNVPGSYSSIQAAVNAAASGDTISVGAGTYNEKVTVNKSGITLISSPARAATIDGSGKVSAWDGVVTVNGYSNIKISGFKIINSGYAGVAIYGDSGPTSNVIVENNYFNNILSSAIVAARCGPGIVFDRNEVTGSHTAPMGSENETIDMITVDGFEIKNNYIHGNYNVESIDVKSGSRNGSVHHNDIVPVASAGIYLDARMASEPALQNINIYNNKVHDGMGGGIRGISIASEEGGAVYHIKIYNNIVYNMGAGGIVLASYNGDTCFGGPCYSGPTDDIKIVNNTVYNNDHTSGWNQGGISYDIRTPPFAPTNVVMQNNISWNNSGPQVRSPSGAAASNNYTSNPSVVNAAGGDFHLTSGSTGVIGQGLFSALLSGGDYDGKGWKNPPSIGAYEYCTSGCPSPTATPIPTATATPIPTGTATPTPTATATPTPTPSPCGNAVIDAGEVCDTNGNLGCISPNICNASCAACCVSTTGNSCTMTNTCGASNTGVIKCDGSCSVAAPALPPGVGDPCNSTPNACGQTNSAVIACDLSCPAPPPPMPLNLGGICYSTANACGQLGAGTATCSGCDAPIPALPAGFDDGNPCTIDTCDISGAVFHSNTCGGFVSCGRAGDNPTTGDIDESKPCSFCAFFYMLKNVINFVLELAIGFGVFVLIIAGLFYAMSFGNSRRIETAKSIMGKTVSGVIIIFIGWLLVAVILQVFGYANISVWNQVNCL